MKLAVIAGEASGDFLGADLVAALKSEYSINVELVGVGGPALVAEGLIPLFDYSELSIMGLTAVLARLPNLVRRISQTAEAIVSARPDALLIIDSPDFSHRVARRIKKALPDLPVINYVCPSVWAWKEARAKNMCSYVDLVLAILPFEPEVMKRLGGPDTVFVGHRLTTSANVLAARAANQQRWLNGMPAVPTILLLPGSRGSEISRLLPVFLEAARLLAGRGDYRFVLPAIGHQEDRIQDAVQKSTLPIEVVTGEPAKWHAFGAADAAIAASGTVILELALAGIPVVSAYKTDWLITLMMRRIKTWSAALPNLIADYPIVPEYLNEMVRPGSLARWAERYAADTPERAAALHGFSTMRNAIKTGTPSGSAAARHVTDLLSGRLERTIKNRQDAGFSDQK